MHSFRLLLYPLLLSGINVYFYLSKWNDLPDRLVRQVTTGGIPVSYWNKSTGLVFITLLCLGLTFMLAALLRTFRRSLPGISAPRLKMGGVVVAMYAVIAFITSINFWVLRLHLAHMDTFAIPLYYHLPLVGVSIVLAVMQVLLAREYFYVSPQEIRAAAHPEETANPWRLGVFYFNPADRRLWVTKRSGMGWTLNFGHGMSYVIMAALVLLPMLVLVLVRLNG